MREGKLFLEQERAQQQRKGRVDGTQSDENGSVPALHCAAGRSGGAAAALWGHRKRRGHGGAASGGRWEGSGEKGRLNFLSTVE